MEGATCLLGTEQLYKERDKRALVQVWNVGKKHKDLVRIKEAMVATRSSERCRFAARISVRKQQNDSTWQGSLVIFAKTCRPPMSSPRH